MPQPGYLIRYEIIPSFTVLYIQNPIDSGKITPYRFPKTKHGEQMLRMYLNKITRKYTHTTFSNKLSDTEVMDLIIQAFRYRGLTS